VNDAIYRRKDTQTGGEREGRARHNTKDLTKEKDKTRLMRKPREKDEQIKPIKAIAIIASYSWKCCCLISYFPPSFTLLLPS